MTEAKRKPVREEDLSISLAAANLYTLAISFPLVGVLAALYVAFSPKPSPVIRLPSPLETLFFTLGLVLGIFLHEIIHALGWACFGRMPLRRIRFGVHARTLTPYAHAVDPMPARSYRLGAALPALVLGALPFVVGTVLGRPAIAFFGAVFSFAAGGDLLVLWIIRNVDARTMVQDHPSRAGCLVVDNGEE
jgi:hypothetical protein